jgi:hypothetical protein
MLLISNLTYEYITCHSTIYDLKRRRGLVKSPNRGAIWKDLNTKLGPLFCSEQSLSLTDSHAYYIAYASPVPHIIQL